SNILSRVTGTNASDIFGRLGVLGDANLFLLNPNGIIFGPDASLDISGSFVATTADRFTFGDGSDFSAVNPEGAPLLTISTPIGLQYGQSNLEAPADDLTGGLAGNITDDTAGDLTGGIINEAQLIVGQNLMLSGGTVDSVGPLMAPHGEVAIAAVAGDARVQDLTAQTATVLAFNNLLLPQSHLVTAGDLTLLAGNTLWARDSLTTPFWAIAGGNLHLQGNQGIDILTLNHLNITPFQSGGTLTLVSDGLISGDAHFSSGGDFSILNQAREPGQFVSLYDPIVSVDGDVVFGDYTGTSLKVEATGSITATGDIIITGPDNIATGNISTIGNVSSPVDGTGNSTLDLQNVTLSNGIAVDGISNAADPVPDSALANFLGLNPTTLDILGNGDANEGSALQVNLTIPVNGRVSFDWSFFTGESPGTGFNDFSVVTVSDGTVQELTDVDSGIDNGTFTFDNPGPETDLTIGIGVVDSNDPTVDSSVTLTNFSPNVTLAGTTDPDISILNTSPAIILRAGLPELANPVGTIGTLPNPNPFVPQNPITPPAGRITIGSENNPVTLDTSGGGAGPIILDAQGDIVINGTLNSSFLPNNAVAIGNGGSVDIRSATGTIQMSGAIDTSNRSDDVTGNAGKVSITADVGNIELINTTIDTTIRTQEGSAGDVTIQANRTATATMGTVTPGIVTLQGSDINTSSFSSGDAGAIAIEGQALSLDNTSLRADSTPERSEIDTELFLFDAVGNLLATNDDSELDDGEGGSSSTLDSFITFPFADDGTYVLGVGAFDSVETGDADVAIAGESPTIGQSYALQVSLPQVASGGTGILPERESNDSISTAQVLAAEDFSLAPDLNIQNATTVPHLTVEGGGDGTFDYYQFTATGGTTGTFDIDTDLVGTAIPGGAAGNIRLIANGSDVSIRESRLSNVVVGASRPGATAEIEIRGTSVNIGGSATNPTVIDASTSGTGDAGQISITATDPGTGTIQLGNNTSIQAIVRENASGDGGNIILTANASVVLQEESRLNAGTSGSGNGGDITIRTADPMTSVVNPNGLLQMNNSSIVVGNRGSRTSSGNGGNIALNVGRAELISGSSLQANTDGSGRAGRINIQTTNRDVAQFALSLNDSSISAGVGGNSNGTGQDIVITTDSLALTNGARIDTETLGAGNAGNIVIESDRAIAISGTNASGFNSGISASSGDLNSGPAGDILINQNGPRGAVTLSDNGFLSSGTRSQNTGGNISLNVETLTLNSGGQILSTTTGEGNAGQISITAQQSISLAGIGTEFDFSSIENPFSSVTVTPLVFSTVQNVEQDSVTGALFANADRAAGQEEGFDYYSFEVSAANSQGLFDIDNGITDIGSSETQIDTELFLFNRDTGELLASNDDAETTLGGSGSTSNLDSFIDFTFAAPGRYVVGVGQFDSFAGDGSLVGGAEPGKGQTYDLRVSLANPGLSETFVLDNPNPNEQIAGQLRSAIAARSEGRCCRLGANQPSALVRLSNRGWR
ncbi:MAG: filamentous hemagglutinin N-terminal domain-containing protein, partial [Symploca sp. SIO2B6]|nr:filamentous hemagglutinin N-terminal domain-containing protein [Symploca sp. SIO2B6]